MNAPSDDQVGRYVASAFLAVAALGIVWFFFRPPDIDESILAYRRALASSPARASMEVEAIADPVVRDAAVLAMVAREPYASDEKGALSLCQHASNVARQKCERVAHSPHLRR